MSKYDQLNAHTDLEQAITTDLEKALKKRDWSVIHYGTEERHAGAGLPDIVVSNDEYVLTFEATKAEGAAQDREFNSIRDHLNKVKSENSDKHCFCVYVSPKTPGRMIDSISDNNKQRVSEGLKDMLIMPLSFESLELWTSKLSESEHDLYPIIDFLRMFDCHNEFIDDVRVKKLLIKLVFPNEPSLSDRVKSEERENDSITLSILFKDLSILENLMREKFITTGRNTIDSLIYLVFLKLYEEKRSQSNVSYKDRLRSIDVYQDFIANSVDPETRDSKKGIHKLFNDMKDDKEFKRINMFTQNDVLVGSIDDIFIINSVIPVFSKYKFVGTQIDALGAVYEVLALRAEKDVKAGQFFTPENVVHFMVQLAELHYKDWVLDPACGTGRFLIQAMNDMITKIDLSSELDKETEKGNLYKQRLYGADIDARIAQIAKMNMWIHGDGSSKIFGGREYNGLLLHTKEIDTTTSSFDNAYDVILTNPPLGDVNYELISLDCFEGDVKKKVERFPILPHKCKINDKLVEIRSRIAVHEKEHKAIKERIDEIEKQQVFRDWEEVKRGAVIKESRTTILNLEKSDLIKEYKTCVRTEKNKQKTIESNRKKEIDLQGKLSVNLSDIKISGSKLKGGAMFLSAIWHYLKDVSRPDELPEWRGGKTLIILDEGILNTDSYKKLREFIRSNFYIKAVISLTKDTFMPISKTSTKTSIFYAVKKTDSLAIQKEPIFFAHVENVGVDTTGRICNNDLDDIKNKYFEFKAKVISSYKGMDFDKDLFLEFDRVGD